MANKLQWKDAARDISKFDLYILGRPGDGQIFFLNWVENKDFMTISA